MRTRTNFTFEGTLIELLDKLTDQLLEEHECAIGYGNAIALIDKLFSEIEQSKSYD